ncbi:MAG TPA: hypothetical protein VHB51_03435 [Candidatus Saccharimonadales bacterium]|nr:hypothetical protein [Candidatus Saccharimonadales bacterium]
MKKFRKFLAKNRRKLFWMTLAALSLAALLLFRLGSLTGGLSPEEAAAANGTYCWSGLYHQPLFLPLDLLRSVIFFAFRHHGQTLTRLPDAMLGGLAILAFGQLLRRWHGNRTAALTLALFACGAWTLHVSRLASNDVLYLLALPLMLLAHLNLSDKHSKPRDFYAILLLWGLSLYVPGLIWFVLLDIWWLRKSLKTGWTALKNLKQRLLAGLAVVVWLPLLIIDLTRAGQWRIWLGLPDQWPAPLHYLKELAAVPLHLLVRGPEGATTWLGKAPVLDIFSLAVCLIGIFFYAKHWRANRSHLIASWLVLGIILIALGGAVSLSLLVPMLYVLAATGIAYLLHEWLQVFPINPLARAIGIGLVILAVAASCFYNLRAYFVAWPNDPTTVAAFQEHR